MAKCIFPIGVITLIKEGKGKSIHSRQSVRIFGVMETKLLYYRHFKMVDLNKQTIVSQR